MGYKKLLNCPLCELNLSTLKKYETANHIRWCRKNGLIKIDWEKANMLYQEGFSYVEIVKKLKLPLSVFTRNAPKFLKVRNKSEAQINARKKGKGLKQHSIYSIKKIIEKALNSTHRRLKKNVIKYKNFTLDSTWELKLAILLDEMKIEWTRPLPLKWVDKNGISRNYFPDFYLPAFNLYLDPKNNYAKKVQKEKLTALLEQFRNIIIIDISDINKKFIQSLSPCIGTVF